MESVMPGRLRESCDADAIGFNIIVIGHSRKRNGKTVSSLSLFAMRRWTL
jgi:hypothetical protein